MVAFACAGIGIVAGGMFSTCPAMITLAVVMLFALTSAPSFTPCFQAIPANASPDFTT